MNESHFCFYFHYTKSCYFSQNEIKTTWCCVQEVQFWHYYLIWSFPILSFNVFLILSYLCSILSLFYPLFILSSLYYVLSLFYPLFFLSSIFSILSFIYSLFILSHLTLFLFIDCETYVSYVKQKHE